MRHACMRHAACTPAPGPGHERECWLLGITTAEGEDVGLSKEEQERPHHNGSRGAGLACAICHGAHKQSQQMHVPPHAPHPSHSHPSSLTVQGEGVAAGSGRAAGLAPPSCPPAFCVTSAKVLEICSQLWTKGMSCHAGSFFGERVSCRMSWFGAEGM